MCILHIEIHFTYIILKLFRKFKKKACEKVEQFRFKITKFSLNEIFFSKIYKFFLIKY